MSNNLMHQTPEDQFLHWRKEMERKQEEQARQMQELQACVEQLQRENDQLRSQVENSLELGNDVRDGYRDKHPIVHNKEKEPIISCDGDGDGDAPVDDELSSGRSPSTSLPPGRNTRGSIRAKSQRKHSHYPTLSDAVSGASRRAREQADRRQNQPLQALRNVSMLPNGIVTSRNVP